VELCFPLEFSFVGLLFCRMPPPPKVFNDGHKTHNATEARALQELLKSEKERRKYFEENKLTMVRARNPLTGEATPRDGQGEPIINPNWVDRGPPLHRKKERELTEKIGVQTDRYNCLGNLNKSGRPNSQAVIPSSGRFPPPSSRMNMDHMSQNAETGAKTLPQSTGR
jgi:hypothetical protein